MSVSEDASKHGALLHPSNVHSDIEPCTRKELFESRKPFRRKLPDVSRDFVESIILSTRHER
jgi:hypothetical protein